MRTAVAILFLLIALTAVVSLGYFAWEFTHTAPYLWRQRVRRRLAELRARRDQLTHPRDSAGELAGVADDLFRRHSKSISVDALAAYPGIGPGTVDRVREAGPRSLADLVGFDFRRVTGVGPSRATDLRAAVRKLVADARGRFDAGGCPEGVEYRRRVAASQAAERDRAAATARELAGVEEAIAATEELHDLGRDVTFWNHLFKSYVPGLTDGVLNRPLPAVRVPPPPLSVPVAVRAVIAPPVPTAATAPIAARASTTAAVVSSPPPPPLQPGAEHPWLVKLRAYCEFGFLVARADGRIAQAEKKEIRRHLEEKFGHDGVLVRHIDPLMERTEPIRPFEAEVIAAVVAITTSAERQELFAWAGRVADASGERNQKEKAVLVRLAAAFELKEPDPPPSLPAPGPPPTTSAPVAPPANLLNGRLDSMLRLLVAVWAVDGSRPGGMAVIRSFLSDKLPRSSVGRGLIDQAVSEAMASPPEIGQAAVAVRPRTNAAEKADLLAALDRVIRATGDPTPDGRAAVAAVSRELGLSMEKTAGATAPPRVEPPPPPATSPQAPPPSQTAPPRVVAPTADPLTVLELEPGVDLSADLIRRRFALLTDKLDPAKATALGPEFARLADQKRAVVRAAAEALIAPFGVTLDPPAPPPPADPRHNPDLDDVFGA